MSSTPRSSSRSKRSTTNLANLRLAPLSAKYSESQADRNAPKSPYEEAAEATLAKYAYRPGRSAPTTPRHRSPSATRRQFGGLSRRDSSFEDLPEAIHHYASATRGDGYADDDDEVLTLHPRAMSDAAIDKQPRLAGQGVPVKKPTHKRSRTTGGTTPKPKDKNRASDDDWFSHTGATANALLLESKGQTWLNSRPSATNLVISEDADDEGYEEMAALSATTAKLQTMDTDGLATPRPEKWGSRFGSRPGSRRTSRRGSLAGGARTPVAPLETSLGYFEQASLTPMEENPVFAEDSEDDSDDDDAKLTELTRDRSFGLGPVVDKLMSNLFSLPDVEESGTDTNTEDETAAEARARRTAEAKRRRQEKERLVAPPAPTSGGDGDKVGVWQDAGWLFSVASRALG